MSGCNISFELNSPAFSYHYHYPDMEILPPYDEKKTFPLVVGTFK